MACIRLGLFFLLFVSVLLLSFSYFYLLLFVGRHRNVCANQARTELSQSISCSHRLGPAFASPHLGCREVITSARKSPRIMNCHFISSLTWIPYRIYISIEFTITEADWLWLRLNVMDKDEIIKDGWYRVISYFYNHSTSTVGLEYCINYSFHLTLLNRVV